MTRKNNRYKSFLCVCVFEWDDVMNWQKESNDKECGKGGKKLNDGKDAN